MAQTKSQAKKLSRRQMVMLLGSGVVLAPAAGAAESDVETLPGKECHAVSPMRGTGNQQQPVLMADPCCQDGLKVFKAGFKAVKDATVRGHFKDFNTALTASEGQLMDYCVMVWGLQQNERDNLVEQMQSKYKLAPIK
jgi:hypothetical protein